MKHILILILSTMVFNAHGQIQHNEFVLSFSDTKITNKVVMFERIGNERYFYQCLLFGDALDYKSCEPIGQISTVQMNGILGFEFVDTSGPFEEKNLAKTTGGTVGAVFGVFLQHYFAQNSKGKARVKIKRITFKEQLFVLIFAAAYGGMGYALADRFDGEEFSALEAAAFRSSIGIPIVLKDDVKPGIYELPISLDFYRENLRIALVAIESRLQK